MPDNAYPMFGLNKAGQLHLRCYDPGADGTRICDTAAVACELVADGWDVTVVGHRTVDIVDATNLGYGVDGFTATRPGRLVDVTASLYEAYSRRGDKVALVLADWMDLRTGPGRGHDDQAGLDWLRAVRAGATDKLEALTGLSYQGYLHGTGHVEPDGALVVCGTRQRKRAGATDLTAMMGGVSLIYDADRVVAVTHKDGGDGAAITSVAHVLKNRDGATGTVDLMRPTRTGFNAWQPA
jgi:hypothetical protein